MSADRPNASSISLRSFRRILERTNARVAGTSRGDIRNESDRENGRVVTEKREPRVVRKESKARIVDRYIPLNTAEYNTLPPYTSYIEITSEFFPGTLDFANGQRRVRKLAVSRDSKDRRVATTRRSSRLFARLYRRPVGVER